MKIDLVWSLAHYRSHMLPIFEALPDDVRGSIRAHAEVVSKPPFNRVAMVGGFADVQPLRRTCKMIYVEHGSGQTYGGGDGKHAMGAGYSGSGGHRHEGVIGFISPSQTVADRWKTAPAIAVGCPKLDSFLGFAPLVKRSICFAFHWPCIGSAPEAGSAFDHYAPRLPEIVSSFKAQGWTVYGHGHPRWGGRLNGELHHAGMTVVADESLVLQNIGVMICDNSSIAYELAALGRPVISLNCPEYRRDVEHGLRFWSHVPGIQVDGPDELVDIDLERFVSDDPGRALRKAAVEHAYAFTDGSSSRRAADFIANMLREM